MSSIVFERLLAVSSPTCCVTTLPLRSPSMQYPVQQAQPNLLRHQPACHQCSVESITQSARHQCSTQSIGSAQLAVPSAQPHLLRRYFPLAINGRSVQSSTQPNCCVTTSPNCLHLQFNPFSTSCPTSNRTPNLHLQELSIDLPSRCVVIQCWPDSMTAAGLPFP